MADRTCAIEDCDQPVETRGWCIKHYKRWRRHGDPLAFRPDLAPVQVRRLRRLAYLRWRNMINRCTRPNHPGWKWYGARGIRVCDEWLDFDTFYAAIGDAPEGMSMDRIDNDRGYEPGNVRWATSREQLWNIRNPLGLRTHCPQGHPYDSSRKCRTCNVERVRVLRAGRRAAAFKAAREK